MPRSVKTASQENTWDDSKLAAYVAERNRAAANRIFGNPSDKLKRPIKVVNVKAFNPHRWWKGIS